MNDTVPSRRANAKRRAIEFASDTTNGPREFKIGQLAFHPPHHSIIAASWAHHDSRI